MVSGSVADEDVSLPESLLEVESQGFEGDVSLQVIRIPFGTKRIMSRAFAGCTGLRRIEIPATVEYIAPDAFDGSFVTIRTDRNSYAAEYAEEHDIPVKYVGEISQGDINWKIVYEIRNGTLYINGSGALDPVSSNNGLWLNERDEIQHIVISDGITSLGNGLFSNMKNLLSVRIPQSVHFIASGAFTGSGHPVVYGFEGSVAQEWADAGNSEFRSLAFFLEGPPDSILLSDEEVFSISVLAAGDGLSYEWQYSDTGETWYPRSRANGWTTRMLTDTGSADAEGWLRRCVITDQYGNTAVSNSCVAHYRHEIEIIEFPTRTHSQAGKTAEFSIKAQGDGLHYQWEETSSVTGPWTPVGNDSPVLIIDVTEANINRIIIVLLPINTEIRNALRWYGFWKKWRSPDRKTRQSAVVKPFIFLSWRVEKD